MRWIYSKLICLCRLSHDIWILNIGTRFWRKPQPQQETQDKYIVVNYAQHDTVKNIQKKKRLFDITIDTVTGSQTNNEMIVKIDLNKVNYLNVTTKLIVCYLELNLIKKITFILVDFGLMWISTNHVRIWGHYSCYFRIPFIFRQF